MAKNRTDLIMQFYTDESQAISGECALEVAKGDDLMKGFEPADYQNYSNFFEINSFDFKVSVKENQKSKDSPLNRPGGSADVQKAINRPPQQRNTSGAFATWRSAKATELREIYYPLDFDTFSFKRPLDAASPIFFQKCCNLQTFKKAVLVKRRSQGITDASGKVVPAVGYLRIDFTEVLITGIEWDDGEMVEEKCEFICKGMTIQYRKQNDDGRVEASGPSATWDIPRARQAFAGRRPG